MLMHVYIAICLDGMAPRGCDRASAVDWFTAPELQQGYTACMLHGLEYVAQARLIQPGKTYPKIFCVAPTSIGKGNIG